MKVNMKLKGSTGMILLLIVLVVFAVCGSFMNKKFLEGMVNSEPPTCTPPNRPPSSNGMPPAHDPLGPPMPVPASNPAYPAPPLPPNGPPVPQNGPPVPQNGPPVPGPPPPMPPPPLTIDGKLPPAPPGDEYILKSQIVPPVCPACPTCPPVKVCPKTGALDTDSCPPCPACERCPEPAFECKKVPNYNSSAVDGILPGSNSPNDIEGYLPKPILNNFSTFDNN